jgi:hypothetical protein
VIVVVGAIAAAGAGADPTPTGLAAGIALAAAAAGARVEVVTRLGEDAAGDALLLAFAAAGVGHVATLRDAVHATPVTPTGDEPVDPDAIDEPDDGSAPASSPEPPAKPAAADSTTPPTLDAADVGLAMRYLADYRVIVVVHPMDAGIVREVVAATSWASAHLVCVTLPDVPVPTDLPADAVVLAAADDAEGLAGMLGRYAAAVDAGELPEAAFRATLAASA